MNRATAFPRNRDAARRILPKSTEDIQKMRVAGRLAAEVLDLVSMQVKPGVTTLELDTLCNDHIVNVQQAIPAPLNYLGFPKSICTSVNHQVCHGIPGEKRLKNGDIVNVDVTVIKDGFHGDTSRMMFVGEPSIAARRLCRVAREAMWIGIEMVRPGIHLGDIGHAIQCHAEKHGYSVVREYCGHGIGRSFHEDPQVLHYGAPGTREVLEEGWTFTIEPMVNAGRRHVKLLKDGWTVVTKDRSLSAQWEHTVAVTGSGVEVLTLANGETPIADMPVRSRIAAAGTAVSAGSESMLAITRFGPYNPRLSGGDLDSTWVTKPEVHAEDAAFLVNPAANVIVANDDNYALAA